MKTILKPQIETLRSNGLLEQLFRLVEHGLTYAYTLSWNYVLHLLGEMFDLMGKENFQLCQNVKRFSSLRIVVFFFVYFVSVYRHY